MRRSALAVSMLMLAGACHNATEPGVCLAVIYPAIEVTIVDSVTGVPVADIASGSVQSTGYRDSLSAGTWNIEGELITRQAAEGRPGTYTVYVQAPGYQDFVMPGVKAAPDACTLVKTAAVLARMQPAR